MLVCIYYCPWSPWIPLFSSRQEYVEWIYNIMVKCTWVSCHVCLVLYSLCCCAGTLRQHWYQEAQLFASAEHQGTPVRRRWQWQRWWQGPCAFQHARKVNMLLSLSCFHSVFQHECNSKEVSTWKENDLTIYKLNIRYEGLHTPHRRNCKLNSHVWSRVHWCLVTCTLMFLSHDVQFRETKFQITSESAVACVFLTNICLFSLRRMFAMPVAEELDSSADSPAMPRRLPTTTAAWETTPQATQILEPLTLNLTQTDKLHSVQLACPSACSNAQNWIEYVKKFMCTYHQCWNYSCLPKYYPLNLVSFFLTTCRFDSFSYRRLWKYCKLIC